MEQKKLWDYYQSTGAAAFGGAGPRLAYLASRFRKGERVLNIGIGNGAFEMFALRRGLAIHSLDPSEVATASLRENLQLGDRVKVGVSSRIPWPDASFDGVVMSEVVEHLEKDELDLTLAEIKRVLVPGGLFWGTVPWREDLSVNAVVCPDCGKHYNRWGHVQAFDEDSLAATLLPHGYTKQVLRKTVFAAKFGVLGQVRKAGRWALSTMGLVDPQAANLLFAVKSK